MNPTLRDRLLLKLRPCPDDGCDCLLWTGLTMWKGYGVIKRGERQLRVHRVAWELENGPIPDGLAIDHVLDRGCSHKTCCNVAHLEPVTPAENTRRWAQTITHCLRRGHPLDAANTYVRPNGQRECRACKRRTT